MSTAIVVEQIAEASPRLKARVAGIFYLLCGMAYSFADGSVRGKLVVVGDAAATAHNILAHESLYRLGFALDLISALGYITVTLLLYDMFRPVNRSISLLAAFFSLTGCAIQAFSTLFHLAPLVILGGEQYLSVFTLEQLQALALMFLKLRAQTSSVYMVFFVSLRRETRRRPGGTIADPVAPRDRPEPSTMAGAGPSSRDVRMKAAVYSRYGTPDMKPIRLFYVPVFEQDKQISKQQRLNSMFRRTHGNPYWS